MKRIAAAVGAVLAVVLVGALLYGTFIEPRFILDEERIEVELPGADDGWTGAEMALFSDIQLGMWLANPGMVRRVVDRILAEDPDAVLIAGDFVYSEVPDVTVLVDGVMGLLEPLLDNGTPTFAVLGNHDYDAEAVDELTRALTDRGVEVLINESAVLGDVGDTDLHIVGLGAHRPGMTDVQEALDDVPQEAPRVVMMHNPASFPDLPPFSAPVAVAGHTHCAQIDIPGTPVWSWLELRAEERIVVEGWGFPENGAPGNRLYVTCGIGFSLIPVRINAPPQVVFFDLVGPGGAAAAG